MVAEIVIFLVAFAAASIGIELLGGSGEPSRPVIAANADSFALAVLLP